MDPISCQLNENKPLNLNLVDCTLMQSVHNVCKQITDQTIN